MVAQTLLSPVSGRKTSIITRRQSQPGSSQYNSTNPYSPWGRLCRCGTVTHLVSRAPTSGNRCIKGIMAMVHLQARGVGKILADFAGQILPNRLLYGG